MGTRLSLEFYGRRIDQNLKNDQTLECIRERNYYIFLTERKGEGISHIVHVPITICRW